MWDQLGLTRGHAHARTLMLYCKQRQQVCSLKLPLLLDAPHQAGLSMRLLRSWNAEGAIKIPPHRNVLESHSVETERDESIEEVAQPHACLLTDHHSLPR